MAEMLITLAIVGIVAAFSIAIFLPKVNDMIRERQISSAKVKCLEIPSGSGLVTPFQNSF